MQLLIDEQNLALGAIPGGKMFNLAPSAEVPAQLRLGWGLLALGPPGNVLTVLPTDITGQGGAGGITTGMGFMWQNPCGSVSRPTTTNTVAVGVRLVLAAAGDDGWTLTLPAAASVLSGFTLVIKQISGAGTITITPAGSDNLEGANSSNTSLLAAALSFVAVASDGSSNWWVVNAGTA